MNFPSFSTLFSPISIFSIYNINSFSLHFSFSFQCNVLLSTSGCLRWKKRANAYCISIGFFSRLSTWTKKKRKLILTIYFILRFSHHPISCLQQCCSTSSCLHRFIWKNEYLFTFIDCARITHQIHIHKFLIIFQVCSFIEER